MLHKHRVDLPVVVERPDRGDDVGLGGRLGQMHVWGAKAELGRLLLLHPDVAGAGGVVADQDGAKPGLVTSLDQRLYPRLQVCENGCGDRGALKNPRGHVGQCFMSLSSAAGADGRPTGVPRSDPLELRAHPEQGRLIAISGDELHAHRQPVGRLP